MSFGMTNRKNDVNTSIQFRINYWKCHEKMAYRWRRKEDGGFSTKVVFPATNFVSHRYMVLLLVCGLHDQRLSSSQLLISFSTYLLHLFLHTAHFCVNMIAHTRILLNIVDTSQGTLATTSRRHQCRAESANSSASIFFVFFFFSNLAPTFTSAYTV